MRVAAGLAGLTALSEPGVAEAVVGGTRLLVLPRETVDAVTYAVGALGKPYVPTEGTGPTAYSCDGLVHAAYGAAVPATVADQYAVLTPVTTPRPGDLAFLGPARYGVQGVGIVLDDRTMLTADARRTSVVVADLPADPLGFARPALPHVPARQCRLRPTAAYRGVVAASPCRPACGAGTRTGSSRGPRCAPSASAHTCCAVTRPPRSAR